MSNTNPSKMKNSLLHSDTLSRILGANAMQILRCGICMDFFEVPIVLPCGHTFCLQCLTQICTQATSLNQASGSTQDIRIGCPKCRVLIYATPILRRNVTCNFIIQSLIECLRVREDSGPPLYSQGVNTDGAGDSKSILTLSSSLSSSSSTPAVDNNNEVDVTKMLYDLDQVTMTLTRSNVVDRAFMEIEDIRKEHLARERQRQADRDAKTRDQVRAVQSIMKQSREEEQQQQQQRKHQHQYHHFQQQQQQQVSRQHQQRHILPRPQQFQNTTQQQQQQQLHVSVNSNQSQQLNLFHGKYPLLITLNSENGLPQHKTQQLQAQSTQSKQQHMSQQAQSQTTTPPAPQQQQRQPQHQKEQQHHQLHRQHQQPQIQSYSQRLNELCNISGHYNPQITNDHQQLKATPLVLTQERQQQQQQHHQYNTQQPQQRKAIASTMHQFQQMTASVSDINKFGTPSPLHNGPQVTPCHATFETIVNRRIASHQPVEEDATRIILPVEDAQGVTAAKRQEQASDKPSISGFSCVQLNNDPAVMSFSLVSSMLSSSKGQPRKAI